MKHPRVALDELVTIVGGGTPSKARPEFFQGRIPWVSPKDMKSWYIVDSEDHITEKAIESSSTSLIDPGAVLVVIRSGILKHTLPVAINRVPVTLNQDMKALVCGERVVPEYLARAIQAASSKLLQTVRGTTADNIPTDVLRALEIPVPLLSEQKRIAMIFQDYERLQAIGPRVSPSSRAPVSNAVAPGVHERIVKNLKTMGLTYVRKYTYISDHGKRLWPRCIANMKSAARCMVLSR